MAELELRRKLTFEFDGKKVVFIKKAQESLEHVLGKATVYALYRGSYPDLQVEVPAGDRYKPDLLATDDEGEPLFWAEVGTVKRKKVEQLLRRYPGTHFVFARHQHDPKGFESVVRRAVDRSRHASGRRVEVLGLPPKKERFIQNDGRFIVSEDSYTLTRLIAD